MSHIKLTCTRVFPKRSRFLVHSSTLDLMGPTWRELAIVATLMLLSSRFCWISSVPPRINTSLESLWGSTINSVAFHESSTYYGKLISKIKAKCFGTWVLSLCFSHFYIFDSSKMKLYYLMKKIWEFLFQFFHLIFFCPIQYVFIWRNYQFLKSIFE